ncbi:MAG: aconitate hydratase AcnA [Planctomycetota bacterium]
MDSFRARSTLKVSGRPYEIWRLDALASRFDITRLPYSLKVLLENLLRCEDGETVRAQEIEALAGWSPAASPDREIAFTPSRVLLQDFTGVPAVVDLAAMREAVRTLGKDPSRINPLQPVELVIDHSVQVDYFGTPDALERNVALEFGRNRERYLFLKWGQKAFRNFRVVPPATGIVHQVNLEYLARVVFVDRSGKVPRAYPDTLLGTDSHTTMVNGLGVLGWGVGGIEAEAAMLGQPVSMLIPPVVGFKLTGRLPEGATATDLVLTATQMLRQKGVVGKFVEFYGSGLESLPLADRATLANMSPEYGATCGLFPIDRETLRYLELTGRTSEQIELVEAYAREQGFFYQKGSPEANYSDTLELDLATVEPSLAGPKRPQDRITLRAAKAAFIKDIAAMPGSPSPTQSAKVKLGGGEFELRNGAVVIAAITSCTNTSNPDVLIGAGLLARNAVACGLKSAPWVKTSLAPGSQVVTMYLERSNLLEPLRKLGFEVAGYGCTTCIGNSGPLPQAISQAIQQNDLTVAAVLSGNRNFEGRIHADVKMNYLASPALVVAYALAGNMNTDMVNEPLGTGSHGKPVYLRDIWPSRQEIHETVLGVVKAEMFTRAYRDVFAGNELWRAVDAPSSELYEWDERSTYVKLPPFFANMTREPPAVSDLRGARVLAVLGDSVTTDHISPAGSIKAQSPAGKYLIAHGVQPQDFNSYGARRGNHEVMMRGTFANVRLRNRLVPGVEGGVTIHLPDEKQMSIYDAAMQYERENVPLVVLAGKEYGSGSSRDWAAKGTKLLGIRAVIAESFERIHRSNLVGMGILPLQFEEGENAETLGLTGKEIYDIVGLAEGTARKVTVTATAKGSPKKTFTCRVRIDTPNEIQYYRHGGILQYVLRGMIKE